MKFILENYLVFVLIGFFLIFALIGYIIDTLRKNNNENTNNIPLEVKSLDTENNMKNLNDNISPQIQSVDITNPNINNDELLNSYNDTNEQ